MVRLKKILAVVLAASLSVSFVARADTEKQYQNEAKQMGLEAWKIQKDAAGQAAERSTGRVIDNGSVDRQISSYENEFKRNQSRAEQSREITRDAVRRGAEKGATNEMRQRDMMVYADRPVDAVTERRGEGDRYYIFISQSMRSDEERVYIRKKKQLKALIKAENEPDKKVLLEAALEELESKKPDSLLEKIFAIYSGRENKQVFLIRGFEDLNNRQEETEDWQELAHSGGSTSLTIEIDPPKFAAYGINEVPAVLHARNGRRVALIYGSWNIYDLYKKTGVFHYGETWAVSEKDLAEPLQNEAVKNMDRFIKTEKRRQGVY